MTNGTSIQVRLTRQQKERALLACQNAGHKTISQFVRSLILEYDASSQRMLKEIYKKIILEGKNGL